MKNIAFYFICTLLYLLSGTSLEAQTEIQKIKNGQYGTPQERAAELDQKMQQLFGLNAAQMSKISPINLRYAVRTENEVVKAKLSNWSKYWKIKAIQSDKDRELKPILTADQFKKYTQKRDEILWAGMKAMLF